MKVLLFQRRFDGYLFFQLEIAKRKEASCIVQYAKREQEMAELKVFLKKLIAYHMFS